MNGISRGLRFFGMARQKFSVAVIVQCWLFAFWQSDVFAATVIAPAELDAERLSSTEPALLVISYDAFRPEYFNRNVTPFMDQLRKEASSAEYMRNVFPTKTFVNHFSIATVSLRGTDDIYSWCKLRI